MCIYMCVYVCICICVCVCVYIYIYIYNIIHFSFFLILHIYIFHLNRFCCIIFLVNTHFKKFFFYYSYIKTRTRGYVVILTLLY